jgi:DNA uptake protein ComE-like DNA-binding protein
LAVGEGEPAADATPAVEASTPTAGQGALSVISRLSALEARVNELSSSAISGTERNASALATLEGRVGELATSTVAGVERNSAELTAIEKRVSELANSAVAGVERNKQELTELEQRVTEIARSAVEGVERNAAQLATIDTRLGELTATAATAREHQGSELGSLQTRVGELAAFAELRGEALGQRIDELERAVSDAEETRSRSVDSLATRLDAIEQRLGVLDGRLKGVESGIEPLADVPGRLGRIEGLAVEVWKREEAVVEQQRVASEGLERLEGIAKLNEASFEQLRTLGLSGTQAARLLAAREARSGFGSVEELEDIPGFPPAVIAELKQLVDS